MRKEADDTGPLAELEHWQYLTARFNSFLEQLKLPKCKHAIEVLSFAKSKYWNNWKQIDMRITDQANEATDNVRYLGSLESACKPLYACEPTAMAEHIPNLIKVISSIYQVSRYYNTSQRMTSLFIKVTTFF
jgi:dynein heavy chain